MNLNSSFKFAARLLSKHLHLFALLGLISMLGGHEGFSTGNLVNVIWYTEVFIWITHNGLIQTDNEPCLHLGSALY